MADYISKFPAHQIDALLEQGVPIYDDVSKLPQDATVGSVAVVAVPGTSKESSFRDLYQPDASILDQNTGAITTPELLSRVSSIKVTAPEGNIEGVASTIYIIPRDFSQANPKMMAISIQASNNIVTAVGAMVAVDSQSKLLLITYNEGVPTVDNSAIETINNYLTSEDWRYIGSPNSGFAITEEEFATLDKFIHPVAGIPSTADVYVKGDKWEYLHKKDLDKLARDLDKINTTAESKADKITITTYSSYKGLQPNVYTTYSIGSTGSATIKLAEITDTTLYNEYILELKFTSTPSSVAFKNADGTEATIVWANGIAPTFEAGCTYLISIVNNFGVFAKYINS